MYQGSPNSTACPQPQTSSRSLCSITPCPHAMHRTGNSMRCGRHVIRSCVGLVQELQHTSATLAAMETSETTLKAANTQYRDQRGTIKQSHTLLRTMRVNSLKDSLKLYAALAFFTLVMAYIGFRRMSYFVPPAIINSLPSLKTFGIGQTQANSSAGMAYLDQQQYEVPGTDGGGNEGHSTAGKSSSQTRLAEVQRHAGNLLRQGAHYSRRLAVWLVQQSQRLIAGIKQKIEERQGRKLGQGDPPGGKAGIATSACPAHVLTSDTAQECTHISRA